MSDTTNVEMSVEDAAEKYLERSAEPEEKAVEDANTETEEPSSEEASDDGDANTDDADGESSENTEEASEEDSPEPLSDDAEVAVEHDGETHKLTVRELKDLAKTRLNLRKQVEAVTALEVKFKESYETNATLLDSMKQRVAKRMEKYKGVDLLKASRELDESEYEAMRAEVAALNEEWSFLQQEEKALVEKTQAAHKAILQEQAKAALPEIKRRIPEWTNEHYRGLLKYALDLGMPDHVVTNIVDPAAIEIIHKAWKFDQAKTVAAKVKPTKVAPRTPVKKGAPANVSATAKAKTLEQRLAKTGDIDDAVALYVARSGE